MSPRHVEATLKTIGGWLLSDEGGLRWVKNIALFATIALVFIFIGAAGFVIAFALQNSLGIFASGILIMVFKPFDIGDLVEVCGVLGKVRSMPASSLIVAGRLWRIVESRHIVSVANTHH